LAALLELLAPYKVSEMIAVETSTFDSTFNWKVLTDNFMEAHHHVAIHGDTLEAIFPAKRSNTPDNERSYSVLYTPIKEQSRVQRKTQTKDEPVDGDSIGGLIAASVFPLRSLLACLERHWMIPLIET
jgi:phenylpropionate dioxygenase-like ring-hydroxylating dioxygenase large terminal subunit